MGWQTLTFSDFKSDGLDDRQALSQLVNTALEIQSQLETRYLSDGFLKDMILRATSREPFTAMIHLSPTRTSMDLIERLNLSIDARSLVMGSREVLPAEQLTKQRTVPAFAN